MRIAALFVLAGLCELGGGYLVWLWLREQRGIAYGLVGFGILAVYGIVPTFQPVEHPFGRVYAAYGAIFIVLSVAWGWLVDGQRPDGRDALGTVICVAGALLMLWPRGANAP